MDACYKKQNEIDKELKKLFNNTKRYVYDYINELDPSGKSTERDIVYEFSEGAQAGTACIDWEKKFQKKMGWSDDLQVFLDTKDYVQWLISGKK